MRKPRVVSWIPPLYPSHKKLRNHVHLAQVRQPHSFSQNQGCEDNGGDNGIRRESTISHSRSGIGNALFWRQSGNENFPPLLQFLGLGWMGEAVSSWPFENWREGSQSWSTSYRLAPRRGLLHRCVRSH